MCNEREAEPAIIWSNDFRLYGMNSIPWQVEKTKAKCIKKQQKGVLTKRNIRDGIHPNHEVPDAICRCGLYAVHDPFDLINRFGFHKNTPHVVLGVVECWGKVILGSVGLRAQYAKPVAITTWCYNMDSYKASPLNYVYPGHRRAIINSIGKRYRIPVYDSYAGFGEMIKDFPPERLDNILPL